MKLKAELVGSCVLLLDADAPDGRPALISGLFKRYKI